MPEIRGELICDRDEPLLRALAFPDLKAPFREIDVPDIEARQLSPSDACLNEGFKNTAIPEVFGSIYNLLQGCRLQGELAVFELVFLRHDLVSGLYAIDDTIDIFYHEWGVL